MRLLYLTDRLSHRGGAQHHLLDVINAMANKHTVSVAAASKDGDVELPPHVAFHKIGGLRSPTKSLDALDTLLSTADVVHLQNVMNATAIDVATQRPCVVTIQDHRPFCPGPGRTLPSGNACQNTMGPLVCQPCVPDGDKLDRALTMTRATQNALSKTRHIIVLSRYMADEIQRSNWAPVTIIPPPVDIGPHKAAAGKGLLLAGRMVHLKAPEDAYTAWVESNTNHPLRVAGLGSAIEDMPKAESLGWLNRKALREAMATARAVLFPARWQEPFGIVGAEALAMGTPVIANPKGGMNDWCTKGTISVANIDEMATAIQRVADDTDYALKLGREGQSHIRHLCAPERVHPMLETVYQRVVDRD